MALQQYDVNATQVVYSNTDVNEPRTMFHVRTLTLSQRARCLDVAVQLNDILNSNEENIGTQLVRAMPLALELWEMLIVDVTMAGVDVPRGQGRFGVCVPKQWCDSAIGEFGVLMDVLGQALAANMAGSEEKKMPGGSSTGASGLESLTAGSVLRTDGRTREDADEKAALTTPTQAEERSGNVH